MPTVHGADRPHGTGSRTSDNEGCTGRPVRSAQIAATAVPPTGVQRPWRSFAIAAAALLATRRAAPQWYLPSPVPGLHGKTGWIRWPHCAGFAPASYEEHLE